MRERSVDRGLSAMAEPAVFMEDPAVPSEPAVTIAARSLPAVCGSSDEGVTYRTVRPGGTTDWLLLVTVAGRGRLRRPGPADVVVDRRHVAAIEPRTLHDYGTDPETGYWSLRWAHLDPRPDWLPLLDWPVAAPGVRVVEVDDTVRSRVVRALDRAAAAPGTGLRRSAMFAMNAVEEALLWCDIRNPRERVLDPRLLTVLEHVGATLDQQHSVASLARVGGLSSSRLAHLAAAQLGTSLMAHVDRQRMNLARHLLSRTDLPIAQVAARVGFTDPLYFSRRFRVATSISPSEFRAGAAGPER
jgi:AraC family transcriptional regulator of arabinose operon